MTQRGPEVLRDMARGLQRTPITCEADAEALRMVLGALEEARAQLPPECDVGAGFARVATVLRTRLDEWERGR